MRLSQTIIIHGGGPGSGCKGSNCGRIKKSHELLQKAGYKTFKGKGFGVQEGETAYVKGRGKDAHVVVVGEDEIREHRPYGDRARQFDESHITHSQLESLLKKLGLVKT